MSAKVKTYLDNLRRSGLIPEDQLQAHLGKLAPSALEGEPDAVGQYLIQMGALTAWQHRMLLRGIRNGFFVGKHKLLGRIGAGGMSIVYLGKHIALDRHVAIKVLDSRRVGSGLCLERFFRESRATASMDHPNVVRVYDFDTVAAHHYLVMEFIDGPSLQDLVDRIGPLPLAPAVHYLMQAASGLACAHAAGMVHRDVKPGNLLVNSAGMVKVTDLGLARVESSEGARLTMDDGSLLGTIDYISPEQAFDSHHVGPSADIYSLGSTLYFLLTGTPPFAGGTMSSKLLRHQLMPPPSVFGGRGGAFARVEQLIMRMMAKRPEDRPTAEAIRKELSGWSDLGIHNLLESGGCRPDSLRTSDPSLFEDTIHDETGSTVYGVKPAGWTGKVAPEPGSSSLDLLEPLRKAQAALQQAPPTIPAVFGTPNSASPTVSKPSH